MGLITQIAVSGLSASALRVVASANNIANAESDGYTPQTVDQVSSVDGSVKAEIVERRSPVNPYSAVPQVNLDEEIITIEKASQAYKAGAQLISVDKELHDTLFEALEKD